MKWSNFFTVPDKELVSDGAVDPMGMQLIWTYFGQQIFHNKLTTVSTDIRNYTINLLHHFVLYKFQQVRNDHFRKAQSQFSDYKDAYETKAGLLIFLEDLLVYSLIDQKISVNAIGLLGGNKAQDDLDRSKGNYNEIEIHAERSKGILVRQIQLGVNGRYKGPFMNMGLMSKNFEYSPIEFERIEELISNWQDGMSLVNKLLELLSELLNSSNRNHPVVKLNRYKNDEYLWSLYVKCFGQKNVNDSLKDYWLEKLGINTGAARSIFHQMGEFDHQSIPIVIASAYKNEEDEKEKQLLRWILDIEPFLSRCAHAFYILSDISVKKVTDIQSDLDLLVTNFPIENVLPLTGRNDRLGLLVKFVKDSSANGKQFAEAIVNYHKKIMHDRGGAAWLEIEGNNIRHYIPQTLSVSVADVISGSYWYNRYYLDAVKSIYNGLYQN